MYFLLGPVCGVLTMNDIYSFKMIDKIKKVISKLYHRQYLIFKMDKHFIYNSQNVSLTDFGKCNGYVHNSMQCIGQFKKQKTNRTRTRMTMTNRYKYHNVVRKVKQLM